MFNLATAVDNAHPMMSILLERGWGLGIEGESKLFIQANHPDIISEIGGIISANDIGPVLNIITRASLDEYINLDISKSKAPEQEGGTCYANASATVIHLAQKRIYEREKGVEKFEVLRDNMIKDYGKEGAAIKNVLEKYCMKYRLQYKEVDERGAKIAVSRRRPVVATFYLNEYEWNGFSKFYESNKQGILRKTHLNSSTADAAGRHAVVLVKVTPEYLLFMNSWGTKWGDDGFFRVKDASVLDLKFYDVFWTLSDLKVSEKAAYEKLKKSGGNLTDKIPESIKSLSYTCPKCNQSSPAKNFAGHFQEAICPKCRNSFIPLMLGFTVFN